MTSGPARWRQKIPAVLVLENGRVFRGRGFGAPGEAFGEAVFNTSMTGYQEILTDPSYAGQIVVMTAPQIGNTGVNGHDVENAAEGADHQLDGGHSVVGKPACAGFAVREASFQVSSWRAQGALDEYLASHGVVSIEGIDTRALTRALRTAGAQRAAIATGIDSERDIAGLLERVRSSPSMEGQDLAAGVTCAGPYEFAAGPVRWQHRDKGGGDGVGDVGRGEAPDDESGDRFHVVAYDFGMKQSIAHDLRRAGCRITVVPAHTPAGDALAHDADGYFLSNGPGDPAAVTYAVAAVRELVASGKPIFGICLGHQILALALGARTYKLPFGHHGGNHPVEDLATGAIEITAQNHGFAVDRDSLPDGVIETHVNLYDRTVEGLRLADRPVFSVQYHPEASPGPHDAGHLFGRFVEAMRHAR